MRKQFIPKMFNETNGLIQRGFHRKRVGVVAWLSLILLLANLGTSAAQERPTTQTSTCVA